MDPLVILPSDLAAKILFYVFPTPTLRQIFSLRLVSVSWKKLIQSFRWVVYIPQLTKKLPYAIEICLPLFRHIAALHVCSPLNQQPFSLSWLADNFNIRTSLRCLSLMYVDILNQGPILERFSKLESLAIQHCSHVGKTSFMALRALSNLTEISLSTPAHVECLTILRSLYKLNSLGLYHLRGALELELALSSVPQLKSLTLGNLRELGCLEPLLITASSLTSLIIVGSSIDESELSVLAKLSKLSRLDFTFEYGLHSLNELTTLSSLQVLRITCSGIQDATPLCRLPKLHSLRLKSHNPSEASFLPVLQKSTSLQSLSLAASDNYTITAQDLAKLSTNIRKLSLECFRWEYDKKYTVHARLYELRVMESVWSLPHATLMQQFRSVPVCETKYITTKALPKKPDVPPEFLCSFCN